jgi:hypothetical protein
MFSAGALSCCSHAADAHVLLRVGNTQHASRTWCIQSYLATR